MELVPPIYEAQPACSRLWGERRLARKIFTDEGIEGADKPLLRFYASPLLAWTFIRKLRASFQMLTAMLRHHFLIAWRHVLRQRFFSLINLLGLAVGLTAALLIALWVQDEWQMDRFHAKGDRLYKMVSHLDWNGEITTWTGVPLALGEEVAPELPEIEAMTFLSDNRTRLFTYGDQHLQHEGIWATANFFEHFSYPLLQGHPSQVLAQPHSVVISAALARSLFGANGVKQALGKTVQLNQAGNFQITGVMADVPPHSSRQFDWVMPMQDLVAENPWQLQWHNFNFHGYALLREGTSAPEATDKINQAVLSKVEEDFVDFELQPIAEQYLYGNWEKGQNLGGRISYVRMFGLTALFLLLIACINFMNLATARAGKRAREVGVRKAVGASRSSLMLQFYSEAILMALLALVLAMLATEALMPAFNALTGKTLSLPLSQFSTWLGLLGIALFAGLLAGSYPATMLSAFPTLSVLRGTVLPAARGNINLRRGLVVFQFTISIMLIVATLVIYQQVQYIHQKNVGLDKDQVLTFALPEAQAGPATVDRLRQQLALSPAVLSLTTTDQQPLAMANSTTFVSWDGKPQDKEPVFHPMRVNYDFLKTFRVPLLAGRSFDPSFSGDSANVILNEQSVITAGFGSPQAAIGQKWELWGQKGTVIGVVKDYHIASLYTPIEPLILVLNQAWTPQVYVRLAAGQVQAGVADTEAAFRQVVPDYPFDYRFMDEQYAQMYASEQMMSKLAGLAAGLGIFIACLGLLGLAAFSAEQRLREMSIRKVLGATVPQLIVLMGREFTLLVLVAFGLAVPVSAWLLSDWLTQFAYRIELQPWVFALSGCSGLLIAWATIGWQSWRAARINPAEALRAE